jgi:uncharacterized protein (UPF0332 family)
MEPLDFIALAIRLSNGRNEADLRSAVSRAYYGAFHLARQFVQDCGVRFHRKEIHGAEIHQKVRYCLSHSADVDAMFVGDRLGSLRGQRNKADYDLDSAEFRSATNVAARIRAAQEIVDALQRCRMEPAFCQSRENVRMYSRDVLRLAVDA